MAPNGNEYHQEHPSMFNNSSNNINSITGTTTAFSSSSSSSSSPPPPNLTSTSIYTIPLNNNGTIPNVTTAISTANHNDNNNNNNNNNQDKNNNNSTTTTTPSPALPPHPPPANTTTHRSSSSITYRKYSAKTAATITNLPVRLLIALMGVFACLLLSSTQYNLSIAIISMVDDSCTPATSICAQIHRKYMQHEQHQQHNHHQNHPQRSTISLDTTTTVAGIGMDTNDTTTDDTTTVVDIVDIVDIVLPSETPPSPFSSSSSQSLTTTTTIPPLPSKINLTYYTYLAEHTNANKLCNKRFSNSKKKLNWSEAEQGLALGAYYYGFAATHIFGGRLAERSSFGPKWITAIGLMGAAVLNVTLPLVAGWNFIAFVIIRAIIGAFHGVVHPALFFMFQNWFPKREQSTALSMLLLGSSLGLILNVPIAGAISNITILDGWPLLFYGGSLLHLLWLLFWYLFVADQPEQHHLIKDKEIIYIRQNSQNILETNLLKAPWKRILTSKVLYASIFAKVAFSFNHAVIIDNGPSYLNKIHGYDMYMASVYIAVVYLFTSAMFMSIGAVFPLCQKLLPSVSLTRLRKAFQSIVFLGAVITMFIVPAQECNKVTIIVLLLINMITQGFVAGGEYPLLNEFSGNYSGTVYGIAITFDSLARFIAPIIRGELVKKADTLANWNIMFYINAALNLLALLVFTTTASAMPQSWALKKDLLRQVSDDGRLTKIPLEKPAKRELKRELQNPNFRLNINTETDDWKEFKVSTLVQ